MRQRTLKQHMPFINLCSALTHVSDMTGFSQAVHPCSERRPNEQRPGSTAELQPANGQASSTGSCRDNQPAIQRSFIL
ncbi:hypothetical protein WJX84_008132 [Apatococcus fuscideae]|uniref:Uncharacterized protein n=1 Tax=Apatococcus fuscideae TaxID=2026836 RepID=A0AAW1TIJ0_9CHLO